MEELRRRFKEIYPEKFFLSNSKEELNTYLKEKGWIESDEEVIELEKPGEGNMNLVKRVKTNKRSFIIKQARPWVEKYPTIDAPVERSIIEARYFKTVNRDPVLRSYSPELLSSDPEDFILVVNDFGSGADYSFLYQPDEYLIADEIKDLTTYLSRLHQLDVDDFPENRNMKILNHEHIFHFPYLEDNGLNLDDIQAGLMDLSIPVKQNGQLKSKISSSGELYLKVGPVLIHGDFFPGSWLRTDKGPKIIDPEFSFLGYPEFDMGVFLANMMMARQGSDILKNVMSNYDQPDIFREERMIVFAGIEILRRIFGVGQLPLALSIEQKGILTNMATEMIMKEHLDLSAYSLT